MRWCLTRRWPEPGRPHPAGGAHLKTIMQRLPPLALALLMTTCTITAPAADAKRYIVSGSPGTSQLVYDMLANGKLVLASPYQQDIRVQAGTPCNCKAKRLAVGPDESYCPPPAYPAYLVLCELAK